MESDLCCRIRPSPHRPPLFPTQQFGNQPIWKCFTTGNLWSSYVHFLLCCDVKKTKQTGKEEVTSLVKDTNTACAGFFSLYPEQSSTVLFFWQALFFLTPWHILTSWQHTIKTKVWKQNSFNNIFPSGFICFNLWSGESEEPWLWSPGIPPRPGPLPGSFPNWVPVPAWCTSLCLQVLRTPEQASSLLLVVVCLSHRRYIHIHTHICIHVCIYMCVLECATNSRRAATAGADGEQEHRSAHQSAATLLCPLLGSTENYVWVVPTGTLEHINLLKIQKAVIHIRQ